jgi:hypothetical protein
MERNHPFLFIISNKVFSTVSDLSDMSLTPAFRNFAQYLIVNLGLYKYFELNVWRMYDYRLAK